ncbi:MAG: aminopeptidase [Kiritimatiellia bacterium]
MKKKTAAVEAYAKAYMAFLAVAKTERRAYGEAVRLLEGCGFRRLEDVNALKPGDKVYRGCHGKTLFAAVVGRAPAVEGVQVVGGHTDAPRLDLKPKPILEKKGVFYFDTHIYGGIKKYQWLVLPLALYGTVVKKDGTSVEIAIGDRPADPVFMISDILPHFGKDQLEKKVKDAVAAEDMDVIAGLGPIGDVLRTRYGVAEDDLLSAELEIVPAGGPREVGLDRALIAAYGHDDRVCAFAGLSALMQLADKGGVPSRTCAVVLCDKEEIGSVGASGMESSFFENTLAELIDRQSRTARDIDVRRALERSQMLSADVCAASDPHFPDADSVGNEARLGKGPCAIKYTGSATKSGASDARAEFVAQVRRTLDGAKVAWQMAELGRAEKGGGGTIAKCMARFGMDVLDFGTPLLNMHAPWELAAKEDCYQTRQAYLAFFRTRDSERCAR